MLQNEITLMKCQYPIELEHKNNFVETRDNQNIEGWESSLGAKHLLLVLINTENALHINSWSEYTSINRLLLWTLGDSNTCRFISFLNLYYILILLSFWLLSAYSCWSLKLQLACNEVVFAQRKYICLCCCVQEILTNAGEAEYSQPVQAAG